MKEIAIFAAFLFAWIALNRWILPAFGIPTCMSGGCSGGACRTSRQGDRPADDRSAVE